MIRLSKVPTLGIRKIFKWITNVPHSKYYKWPLQDVVKTLDYNSSYRYLVELTILNERNKSLLETIDEENM